MKKNNNNVLYISWCNFKLGTFEGTLGYLTDAPIDILTAFIDYHTKGYGIAWFDEEGTGFSLVITPYSLFIIEEDDKPILHDFSEMRIENLEKELISDLESDLYGWSEFITNDAQSEIAIHRDEILQKIAILKYVRGDVTY